MSNNDAGVLPDNGDAQSTEETEEGKSYFGYGFFAVAVVILILGTHQVLSANADREEQTRKVRDAQSKMEVLN